MVCHGTSFSKSLVTDSFLGVTRIQRLRSFSELSRKTCQYQSMRRGSQS